jgi:hypothetical protein
MGVLVSCWHSHRIYKALTNRLVFTGTRRKTQRHVSVPTGKLTMNNNQSPHPRGLLPSKPPPWKYKNLNHQTRRLLLVILLRPDASAHNFQPPSTNRDINWSAPSNTAQFNAPSKTHSPCTVFNTENCNTNHTSTLAIFPKQNPLPELSITTLPTTIPISNTHHGQKPHGKASQRAVLRHPSRKDSSTYRFLHNANTRQSTTTTQELYTGSHYT